MIIVLFLMGLITGSFSGMLSYRLPRNMNIASDRSRCPNCNHIIAWYDNVPLFSFLVLKGKCRNCHHKISFREPLIELGIGIIFVFLGFNPLLLILSAVLITIAVIDLEHQIIPDELVFLGLAIFAIFNIQNAAYAGSLLAGFIAADLLLFLNLVTKGKGMGLGDVKLAILVGSLVGIEKFLVWLFFSFLVGATVGIILLILKKAKMKTEIPFGPFLIIGFALTYYFGNYFLNLLKL